MMENKDSGYMSQSHVSMFRKAQERSLDMKLVNSASTREVKKRPFVIIIVTGPRPTGSIV